MLYENTCLKTRSSSLKTGSLSYLSRDSICHVLNMQMCNLEAILISLPRKSIGC